MRTSSRLFLMALLSILVHVAYARSYDVRIDAPGPEAEAAGWAVASGDMDGDGFIDLAVGSPYFPGNNSGLVRVIRGSPARLRGPSSLSDAATTNIVGTEGIWTGWALAFGDVNKDGYADLAIGQPWAPCDDANQLCGAVQVVYGSKLLPSAINLTAQPQGRVIRYLGAPNDFIAGVFEGMAIASRCDINGDGIDDLIIGAPVASHPTENAGSVYVVYGQNEPDFGTSIRLDSLSPDRGFRIDGTTILQGAGASFACLHSLGHRDVLAIGSQTQQDVFVHTSVWLVHDLDLPIFGSIDLVPSPNIVEIDDDSGYFSHLGANLAAADINGDGCDDLAFSAPWEGDESPGKVYVLYGCSSAYAHQMLTLSDVKGDLGFHIAGQPGDSLGDTAIAAGNLDGDRFGDLVIGSLYSTSSAGNCQPLNFPGVAYIFRGGKANPQEVLAKDLECITPKGEEGVWSSWALALGDFDGNGFDDIASGALYGGAHSLGAVYLCYSGPAAASSSGRADLCNAAVDRDSVAGSIFVAGFD